ncbi:MAG: hypothetical protein BWY16_00715 [Candidatus Omnitrophica bacterium ADurb.Bin205]|nr:MAG: hypothetical protein BWY16_00715 [Candidatus Omnitrophica bacterium ADurb.Bin205]
MKRNLLNFALFSILFFCSGATAAETITITTYYPSPCGSYDELRARKIAIGDNYFNTSSYTWGIQVSAEADLVVEGRVGIGTASPVAKLEVKGGHGDSQIRLFSDQYSQGIGGVNTANLNLWASEPGWTWTGAGIGNNVINTSAGGLTRVNTSRGGSYCLDSRRQLCYTNFSGVKYLGIGAMFS